MISRSNKTSETKANPHKVDVRQLYNKESVQVVPITLLPEETLKTPVDVTFYVLEGAPTVHIGEESKIFKKDDLIESPANIVHYLNNERDKLARIPVTKAPARNTPTIVL
jgi:mannose-6-phosphate isomerase-like protein (cupin superfamily)